MPRPTTYDDALRGRLVSSAAHAVTEHGPEGISLRQVASAAGTSTHAVYTLFGSKAALVDAVRHEAHTSFTAAQQAVNPTDDPAADLRALGRAYRDWALANPDLYVVMFGGAVGRNSQGGPSGDDPAEAIGPLRDAVRRALPAHRQHEASAVELGLWAGVHGCVALELGPCADMLPADREAVFEQLLQALRQGWRLG